MGIFDREPNVMKFKIQEDVEGLIKALEYKKGKKKGSGIRMIAAQALGEIGDTRAVSPLIFALRDKSDSVGIKAAAALFKIGDPRGIEAAIQNLERFIGSKDPMVGAEALGIARKITGKAK